MRSGFSIVVRTPSGHLVSLPAPNSGFTPMKCCQSRECNRPAGKPEKPRSIYCSRRCQNREQNLRQGRVKSTRRLPTDHLRLQRPRPEPHLMSSHHIPSLPEAGHSSISDYSHTPDLKSNQYFFIVLPNTPPMPHSPPLSPSATLPPLIFKESHRQTALSDSSKCLFLPSSPPLNKVALPALPS